MNLMELYCYDNKAAFLKFLSILYEIEVKSIVEIGVWKGHNAHFLHTLFPEAHLYLIDPWKPTEYFLKNGYPPVGSKEDYQVAYENTMRLFKDVNNVTILRENSLSGVSKVPNDIDLVFIDGSHDYQSVKNDILAWQGKVSPKGLFSGHDYHPDFPGVVQAVDECLGSNFKVASKNVWYALKETQ